MTPQQQYAFLRAIANGSTTVEAAAAAGLSTPTFYALRKRDADFAEAWRLALEDSTDVLEREARRRAVDGVQEPVVYQGALTPVWERDADGEPVMRNDKPVQARNPDGSLRYLTTTKYSDALLAMLLKGRRKDVFSDRTEITGANGGSISMDTTERRARLAAIFAKASDLLKSKDQT